VNDVLYKSIDKNMIKSPIAYCKCHKGFLSKKQMDCHRCLARGCTALQKIDEEFWEQRKKRKIEAKERKRKLSHT
jgi:hypothetical protein